MSVRQKYEAFISYSHAADGRLAPEVQAALQKFAKPWYRLRALRAFRDQTTLAATPSLWGSIQEALEGSKFLLLMASPEAAASPWIEREVSWWLENRQPGTMLMVLTGGELLWDSKIADFDTAKTSALPPVLFGKLREEPLYVDLRWAKDAEHLSLRNTRFRGAILDLAATLHARPKDELDGEDVRQHRKTRRVAWAAAASLVLLTVAALAASAVALLQRDVARSRELAAGARTEIAVDPEFGLILAKAAVEKKPTAQAEDALREALLKSNVRLVQRAHAKNVRYAAFVGDRAVSAGMDGKVLVWSTTTGAIAYEFAGFWPSICGDRVALANGSQVAIYSLANGKRQVDLEDHGARVVDVKFSSNCQRVATAGEDNVARVYDSGTGEALALAPQDGDSLTEVSFSPDGALLVTQRIYNRTDAFDVATGRKVLSSPGFAAAFSPDMSWLAVGGADSSGFRLWDVAERRPIETSYAQPGMIYSVAFDSSGMLLLTSGGDRTARVWEAGTLRPAVVLSGHTDDVTAAQFSHGGKYVVTASRDKTARVWVARTGELVAELRGHEAAVNSATFAADDRTVLTASEDGTARIWSLGMADPVLELSGDSPLAEDEGVVDLLRRASSHGFVRGLRTVQQVEFSKDGALALLATDTNAVEVWRLRPAERLAVVTGTIAAFNPDGQSFATGDEDGTVRMFRTSDGVLLREFGTHGDIVTGLEFSADGGMLGSAGDDGTAQIYLVGSGKLVASLKGHSGGLSGLWFSPDGTRVLTTSFDHTAALWELPSGRRAAILPHETEVLTASFSADGALVATADFGGVAKIWDVATARVVTELRGHDGAIADIRFNARGDELLTAGSDGTARLWGLGAKGAETKLVMRGHSQLVYKAAFSPDERFVATVSQDYFVRLWESNSGRLLTVLGTHANAVWDVAFSPDGTYLMSGSEDGTAHVYACEICVPTDRLLALAKSRITRAPTDLEIRNYGLDR